MKLRWSQSAHNDLADILDHLNSENPLAAARLVRRLSGIEKRISSFPESAQEVAERAGVRRIPLVRYPFVLFYKVQNSEVIVLRILHGAMDKPWEGFE